MTAVELVPAVQCYAQITEIGRLEDGARSSHATRPRALRTQATYNDLAANHYGV